MWVFLYNGKWSQEAPAHSFRGKTIHLHSVHLILHNKWSPSTANDNTFREAFQCNYSCNNAGSLKKHMRQHSEEKLFAWNQRSFSCRSSSSLRTHMFSHTGEKPFACKKCNYTCIQPFHLGGTWKSILLRHQYSGEKLYSCSRCSLACITAGNLKDHIRTHSGEKPIHCDQCNYKSTQATHLKHWKKALQLLTM